MPRRAAAPAGTKRPATRGRAAGIDVAPPITVIVADERRAVAEALAQSLGRAPGLRVEVALSISDAVRAAALDGAGVLFLDLAMPGPGGIETIRRVHETAPTVAIVAMGAFDDDLLWARAIEAGATGYVQRSTPLEELPRIARRAAQGGSLIGPEDEARLFRLLRRQRHQDSTERQRVNRLTPRQLEILQLIADGATPTQISEQLGVSPLTLRTHVQNILTRLGVHTKLEAVTVTLRHGKLKTEREGRSG
jgi:DNA-binding NarL/FixJ family response regulator